MLASQRMDIFEIVAAGDAEQLDAALLADPALAATRHPSGASLLAWAHYVGQTHLAERLRRGAGDLALADAIIFGDRARVAALLADGADPDQRSADGFPPLALAAFFARSEIFDLQLPLSIDLDATAENDQRVAAMHAAAARRQAGMIEKLLRAGAAPDLRQAGGFTALHTAARNGDAMSTGLLLLWGADRKALTEDGRDAESLARAAGHAWLTDLLDRYEREAVSRPV